jgi:hypothetical protein
MAEPKVVELKHPDLEDHLVFREDEGFWGDKLAQIEVYKAAGWKEVPKSQQTAGEGGEKK